MSFEEGKIYYNKCWDNFQKYTGRNDNQFYFKDITYDTTGIKTKGWISEEEFDEYSLAYNLHQLLWNLS